MSNKRNRRRKGQRIRAEASRKPVKVTKSSGALIAAQPAERERKAKERYWKRPTKAERKERQLRLRRWRLDKPRKVRKPRTKYGHTYWRHSHDM